jgi:hypothetical protein
LVKKRTIDGRLRDLEDFLIEPPRPVCKVCGAEGGGPFVEEYHHHDGVVSYDPREPCPGCDEVRRPGAVRSLVICPHGCWCEGDPAKVAAAPKVNIADASEEDFWKYANGAAKYHRRLREEQQRKDT